MMRRWPRRTDSARQPGRKPRARRWRLNALEGLEERVLLSATQYLVDSTGNSTTGTGTSGTLPYVVGLANANPSSDGSEISFSPLFNTPRTITLGGTLSLTATAGPVIIDGPGSSKLTISGDDSVGVFEVDSGVTATLTDLTIAHGVATAGGGIFNQGTLTLAGVNLAQNKADDGGALFDGGGAVTISDHCGFTSNAATTSGGGIYQKGGVITVDDSAFSNGSAGLNGGGIFVDGGSLSIDESSLSGNKALNDAGGIYDFGGNVEMSHCTLTNNSAGSGGGGIFKLGTGLGSFAITGSALANNTARIGAGGDVASGSLTIAGSTLVGNKARDAGGGIHDTNGHVQVTSCALSGNAAGQLGGAIDENGTRGAITITGGTFDGNSARYGGAIHILRGALTITGAELVYNRALTHGGALCDSGGGDVRMSRCTLSSNHATGDAGAIMVSGSNAVVTIAGSTIINNSAQFAGGVFVNGGSLTLTGSTLEGNKASTSGGAIYDFRGNEHIIMSELLDNTAGINGGGIRQALTGGQIAITASTIAGNTASSGGGIYLSDGSLSINDSTLSSNAAHVADGGAIFVSSGNAAITNSTISENVANDDGGGIRVAGGNLSVVNATIAYNFVGAGSGGGLDAQAGTTVIDNTIVARNYDGFFALNPNDIAGSVSGSYNLVGTGGSGGLTSSGGNQVNVANPVLGVLADNGGPTQTIALLPGSPAIGKGSDSIPNVTVPAVDQRGVVRPPGRIDVGAFQDRGFTMTIASPTGRQTTPVNRAFAYPFTMIVSSPYGDPVIGGVVTYAAPPSGATAVLSSTTATIGTGGRASAGARANGTVGRYVVTASASGAAASMLFQLTNGAATSRSGALLLDGGSQASHATTVSLVGLMILPDEPTGEPLWLSSGSVPITDMPSRLVASIASGRSTRF